MAFLNSTIFPLGLGTGKLCSLNGGLSLRAAGQLVHHAYDLGIRFVDTAPSYGQGQAERAIGKLPPSVKEQLTICSKVGFSYGHKGAVINLVKPLLRPCLRSLEFAKQLIESSRDQIDSNDKFHLDLQPEFIRTSLHQTLRRLDVARLDLFLLHDPSMATLGDQNRRELERLEQAGEIGSWGVSTNDPDVALRALEIDDMAVLQIPVGDAFGEFEDVLTTCEAKGIPVIANRVLASMRCASGSASDGPRSIQGCFQSALDRPGVGVVLCGTTKPAHLKANVSAINQTQSPTAIS